MAKPELIESIEHIYYDYAAIEFCNNKKLNINGTQQTLAEYINQNQLVDKQHIITIEGIEYSLSTTGDKEITLTPTKQTTQPISGIKHYNKYSTHELLSIVSQRKLLLAETKEKNKYKIATQIDVGGKNCILGDEGKLDLYLTHLDALKNIYDSVKEDNQNNMLIAMATGSGKTFVQALWFLALQKANKNAIFVIPGNLTEQFKRDFAKILPNELVDQIIVASAENKEAHKEQINNALASMKKDQGNCLIASHDDFLKQYFTKVEELDPNNTFFICDEQHLTSVVEAQKIALRSIAKHLPSMFLTATPDKFTYKELSKSKPVVVTSSKQKQETGHGRFPEIDLTEEKSMNDKLKIRVSGFRELLLDIVKFCFIKPILLAMNNLERSASSPVYSALEDLPYECVKRKKDDKFYYTAKDDSELEQYRQVRSRFQMPYGRRILLATDSVEALVNAHNIVNRTKKYEFEDDSHMIFKDGNVRNRSPFFKFLGLPDADKDLNREYHDKKKLSLQETLRKNFGELKRDNYSIETPAHLSEQLENNVFHGLIEFWLRDVTGLSSAQLDEMRSNNLEGLRTLVNNKLVQNPKTYNEELFCFSEKNSKGIESEDAKELSQILNKLQDFYLSEIQKDPTQSLYFVDNWSLNAKLREKIKNHKDSDLLARQDDTLHEKMSNFAKKHKAIYMMKGCQKSDLPINATPFSKFNEEKYDIHTDDGIHKLAQNRKLSAQELLNSGSIGIKYTPNYINSEDPNAELKATNLFSMGLVGLWAGNTKTTGFSDLDLHTVILDVPTSQSKMNNPATTIQALGRLRGLNEFQIPFYLEAEGKNINRSLKIKSLSKSHDYIPLLHAAEKRFHKEFLAGETEDVARSVIQLVTGDNIVDYKYFDRELLTKKLSIVLLEFLRNINNLNDHDIDLSRKQFADSISDIQKTINKEIESLKNPYEISLFIKCLGILLNIISTAYYWVATLPDRRMLAKKSKQALQDTSIAGANKDATLLYYKVINKSSYYELSKLGPALKGIFAAQTSVPGYFEETFEAQLNDNQDIRDQIQNLLLQFIAPEHKGQATKILNDKKDFVSTVEKKLADVLNNLEGMQFDAIISSLSTLPKELGLNDDMLIQDKDAINPGALDSEFETLKEKFKSQAEMALRHVQKTRIMPIIESPSFANIVRTVTDHLNTEDIKTILKYKKSFNDEDSDRTNEVTANVIDFITLLKDGKYQEIENKYLYIHDGEAEPKIIDIFKALGAVYKEQLNILCHYHNMSPNGIIGEPEKSDLVDSVPSEYRIHTRGSKSSFFDVFSRKVFFVKTQADGLEEANEIAGVTNDQAVRMLEEVLGNLHKFQQELKKGGASGNDILSILVNSICKIQPLTEEYLREQAQKGENPQEPLEEKIKKISEEVKEKEGTAAQNNKKVDEVASPQTAMEETKEQEDNKKGKVNNSYTPTKMEQITHLLQQPPSNHNRK